MNRLPIQKKSFENETLGAIENIFRFMEQKTKVEIFITHMPNYRLQGIIRGFDEWMNFVMEQVVEIDTKKGTTKNIGRILLKGDTICLVHQVERQK